MKPVNRRWSVSHPDWAVLTAGSKVCRGVERIFWKLTVYHRDKAFENRTVLGWVTECAVAVKCLPARSVSGLCIQGGTVRSFTQVPDCLSRVLETWVPCMCTLRNQLVQSVAVQQGPVDRVRCLWPSVPKQQSSVCTDPGVGTTARALVAVTKGASGRLQWWG